MTTTIPASKQAVLRTSMGEITIALYDDMPVTAGNFESWCARASTTTSRSTG